jgi:hypothetical protein
MRVGPFRSLQSSLGSLWFGFLRSEGNTAKYFAEVCLTNGDKDAEFVITIGDRQRYCLHFVGDPNEPVRISSLISARTEVEVTA